MIVNDPTDAECIIEFHRMGEGAKKTWRSLIRHYNAPSSRLPLHLSSFCLGNSLFTFAPNNDDDGDDLRGWVGGWVKGGWRGWCGWSGGVGGFPDNGHHSEGESPAALVCLVALVGWLPWPPLVVCALVNVIISHFVCSELTFNLASTPLAFLLLFCLFPFVWPVSFVCLAASAHVCGFT